MSEKELNTLDENELRARLARARERGERAELEAEQARVEQVRCAFLLGDGYLQRAARWLGWHQNTLVRFLEQHPDVAPAHPRKRGRPRAGS